MGGYRKEKLSLSDSSISLRGKAGLSDLSIGLRQGGYLTDAYFSKASELDIYLIALCEN